MPRFLSVIVDHFLESSALPKLGVAESADQDSKWWECIRTGSLLEEIGLRCREKRPSGHLFINTQQAHVGPNKRGSF
jgi:hypothetical protein